MVTPISGADPNNWLILNGVPLKFDPTSENEDAKIFDYKPGYYSFKATPNVPDGLVLKVVGEDEPLPIPLPRVWDWIPRSYAGVYQIEAHVPGHPIYTARVKVFPSQISQERYDFMLDEISWTAYDLLFSLNSPAGARAKTERRTGKSAPLREFELLEKIVLKLNVIMTQIQRNPYQVLSEVKETRLISQINHFTEGTWPEMGALVNLPTKLQTRLPARLPQYWAVPQPSLTYDVYENRLLKRFLLQQLPKRLRNLKKSAKNEIVRRQQSLAIKQANNWDDDETPAINRLEEILQNCDSMDQGLKSWGNQPFFRSVGELGLATRPTQVLQKHPYYSQFYLLYLNFLKELRFSLDIDRFLESLSLNVRKLSELYEMWSVFHLTDIIIDTLEDYGYKISSQNLFYQLEEDLFQFQLKKDVASIVMERQDIVVKFRYEPVYPKMEGNITGLVSIDYKLLKPDFVLELWSQNRPRAIIVFDAKYKTKEENGHRIYLEEDENKLRKYRDLIRYQNPRNPTYQGRPPKIVSSAYVIYPGDVIDHDQSEVEVGALPLITKMEQTLKVKVIDAVEDILEKAGNFAGLHLL